MPTTLLHGENWDQAYKRRFAEEAAIDAAIMAKLSVPYHVSIKTMHGVEQLNVVAMSSSDAIIKAIAIVFDVDTAPAAGIAINAYPLLQEAA